MNKLNAFSIFNKAEMNERIGWASRESKRIESNARGIGIELRISNRTDDDDSTTLAIILDLCMYPAGTHPSAVQPEHRSFGFLGLLP